MSNYSAIPKCKAFLLMPFFLVIVGFLSLYSCKKSAAFIPKSGDTTALIGKWLLTKQIARIYSISGALLRDSTDAFGSVQPGVNSYRTFNPDGSGATLRDADTTEIYTYSISGKALRVYPSIDHTSYNLFNFIPLDATHMELEAIEIGSDQSTVWGLDPAITYKLVEDDYFTRD